MLHGNALFEKIVELCGVSAVLAPGLVRRSLGDGMVDVDSATAGDYRHALPRLLARLRAYVPEEEAQLRARRIAALLASPDLHRDDAKARDEDEPPTHLGRRYTADELEQLERWRGGARKA